MCLYTNLTESSSYSVIKIKFRHVTEPMRMVTFKISKGYCKTSLGYIYAGYEIAIFRVVYE
jgi:hypothetical protein